MTKSNILLAVKSISANPFLSRGRRKFDYTLTFDVDAPYLYKGRGFFLQMGGIIKELASFDLNALKRRFISYLTGKDPYDTFEWLLSISSPIKMIFFFLIDRASTHDGRHTYKSGIYRKLIQLIARSGAQLGIHPSYNAFLEPERIKFEKQNLEEITGINIVSSRMHFLKYRLPDTYNYLVDAGLTDDYTTCPINSIGFKNFIAVPYKWFDLKVNKASNLIIHPTMSMDVSLQKYMALNPAEALGHINKIVDKTSAYGGHFVLLWHNSSFDLDKWKGWKAVFESIVKYLDEVKNRDVNI
jgi:hypothetical protein